MPQSQSKILVLHGYGQSASYVYRKLLPIITECANEVEFYFLDAPMVMLPVDPKAQYGDTTDARYILKPVPTCSTPTKRPAYSAARRGWFKINSIGRDSLPGLEDTLVYLREVLKIHRFDAIFGFSQGAAMAELITAMLERPRLFPTFCEHGFPPHPPLKYIVSVSGFLIRGPRLSWESDQSKLAIGQPAYGFAMSTPVLYVLGRNDVVVPLERSNLLIQHSRFKRVEEHNGGHFIPLNKTKWRRFFVEFFREPFGDITSPTPRAAVSLADEDNAEIVTPKPIQVPTYQTGQILPCGEEEEEEMIFAVVYDESDSSSDSEGPAYSPPETPLVRTPAMKTLDLEPDVVVSSSNYDLPLDGERLSSRLSIPVHARGQLEMKSKL